MLVFETVEELIVVVFRLATAAVFPVILSVVFYRADKKTKFGNLNKWVKQIIIGCAFAIVAILATEFGIPVDGAVLNVRSAAPLCAGLIFGGPAGLIAGTIGAIHRWVSVAWGIGSYTRLACTLGTFIAGAIAALCRQFVFNNKKTTWLYGFIIGVTTEVIHMLMVFFTHLDDLHQAFIVILKAAMPMIMANGISVLLAMFFVAAMGKGSIRKVYKEQKTITQTFQSALLVCVLCAFCITSWFTYMLQSRISNEEIEALLKLNITAIPGAIDNVSESTLLQYNEWIAIDINSAEVKDNDLYKALQEEYEVPELYIIDAEGIIQYGPFPHQIGKSFTEYEQLKDFSALYSKREMIRKFEPTYYNYAVFMRYGGTLLEDNGMVIAGYDDSFLVEELQQHIPTVARSRYIGETGYVLIADKNGTIYSIGREGAKTLEELGINLDGVEEKTVFQAKPYGEKAFCMYYTQNNIGGAYNVIGVYPEMEALFSQKAAVYLGVFMEILVFAVLFTQIYFLIMRGIIKNIHDINDSLEEITNGNLDVKINVRENVEFASLSDDINETVEALKTYIEEAASRIDKELAFAKAIQTSSLPSVFPPYPKRKDFEIYASMRAAKEVGGDFYDFYLIDNNHLGFIMADVSGKGIPAAMFMMTSKSIIKGYAERGLEVNEILTEVNNALCEGNEAEMFVTAWMGILDLQTGMLSFGNAGHNPPLLQRKNGEFEYLRSKANLALAFMEDVTYQKHEIQLYPGDALYLYTDGVTEATNAQIELFGENRLQQALNEIGDVSTEVRCKHILSDIDAFVGEAEQFDDITMLSVNYYGSVDLDQDKDSNIVNREMEKEMKELDIEATLENLDKVMAFVDEELESVGCSMKAQMQIDLAVEEVYVNIANYAYNPSVGGVTIRVMIEQDPLSVVLTFIDEGVPYDPLVKDDPDVVLAAEDNQIGGLGIFMVKKSMDNVSYEYNQGRNILTLKKDLE